jgi:hypothetical protein
MKVTSKQTILEYFFSIHLHADLITLVVSVITAENL